MSLYLFSFKTLLSRHDDDIPILLISTSLLQIPDSSSFKKMLILSASLNRHARYMHIVASLNVVWKLEVFVHCVRYYH